MSVTMSDKEIHRLPEVYAIAMQHHSPAFGMVCVQSHDSDSCFKRNETHDGIQNGVFLHERCEPPQNPSGCYREFSNMEPMS